MDINSGVNTKKCYNEVNIDCYMGGNYIYNVIIQNINYHTNDRSLYDI